MIDPEKNCGPKGSVNLVQNKFKYKDHPRGMVGVGGEEEMIFSVSDLAVKGSKCYIGLSYRRPWELKDEW